jgi:prevent-host-death family protein
METIVPIGELKVHCYKILEQARKDNKKLIITKRGNPIAEIIPTPIKPEKRSLLGSLQDKAKINGDLLEPIDVRWEAEDEQ